VSVPRENWPTEVTARVVECVGVNFVLRLEREDRHLQLQTLDEQGSLGVSPVLRHRRGDPSEINLQKKFLRSSGDIRCGSANFSAKEKYLCT
jgi:hypothetical protein